MKTTKEKFDDLFSEMANFARSTPLLEIEKYELFAKNFSESFNRLYNEIEDIETKREIYDFNFNQDAHLEIALFVWEPNTYDKHEITKNYQSLKRLILNKIPQQPENQKQEISLEDFFPRLTNTQVQNIKNKFEGKKGSEIACFIHCMRKKGSLILVKSNSEYSLSRFIKLFSKENILEGVRKQFQPGTDYKLRDEFKEEEYQFIREKIDEALKVG